MTVSELFKKYDFESLLPHLDHLFMVNSGRHFSEASENQEVGENDHILRPPDLRITPLQN